MPPNDRNQDAENRPRPVKQNVQAICPNCHGSNDYGYDGLGYDSPGIKVGVTRTPLEEDSYSFKVKAAADVEVSAATPPMDCEKTISAFNVKFPAASWVSSSTE